jgi:hypothetical protein
MMPTRMIETHYLPPTNTRGARVVARNHTTRTRVVVPWNHELDLLENHVSAAKALTVKHKWSDTGVYKENFLVCNSHGAGT